MESLPTYFGEGLTKAPEFVNVTISILPIALFGMDENNAKASAVFFISLLWMDRRLAWEPSSKETECHVSRRGLIWTPPLSFYDCISQSNGLDDSYPLTVCSDGNAKLQYEVKVTVSMSLTQFNALDYPFNSHRLQFMLAPTGYIGRKHLQLHFHDHVTLPPAKAVPDWQVLERKCLPHVHPIHGTNEDFSGVACNVTTARRSMYYIINFCMPAFSVTLLAVIGIHVAITAEGQRSTKYQLGLIALVALATILLSVSHTIPRSGSVTRLHLFYLGLLYAIFMSCLVSWILLIAERHYNPDNERASRRFFRTLDAVSLFLHVSFLLGLALWFCYPISPTNISLSELE